MDLRYTPSLRPLTSPEVCSGNPVKVRQLLMMSSGLVTQSDCTLWNHQLEAFPNKETKQKGPQATYPLTVLDLLCNVFELEGFLSYPLQESSGHPRLPLIKSLDFFDLFSLCSFPHFFNAFILQTCIKSPLRVQQRI